MSKRKVVLHDINGTTFIVDALRNELRQRGCLDNTISFSQMDYKGTHYEMRYNKVLQNVAATYDFDPNVVMRVKIPQLIDLHPSGMAARFNLTLDQLAGKSDFDLVVDQQQYQQRVLDRMLPKIDIAGDQFYINLRFKQLELEGAPFTSIDLSRKRDSFTGQYEFFYNKVTKEEAHVESNITEVPNNLVLVVLPNDNKLDPVAVAKLNNYDIHGFLMKYPFEKKLEASVIPVEKTWVAEAVRLNRQPLLSKDENRQNKNKNNLGL